MKLRSLPGLLFVAAILLFIVPTAVGFYTDWLWFQELGYEGLFLRSLNAQGLVFALTFGVVFLFLYANLRFARRRTSERRRVVLGTGANGQEISLEGAQVAGLATPVSLIVALLSGIAGASSWLMWLSYFHAAPFGEADPLLGRDIAFYVFRLPVYQAIRQQALLVSIIALFGCLLYYVLSGSFVVETRPGLSSWPRIRLVTAARRHLSLLAALVLGLMAWGAWLQIPTTLLTPASSSVGFGASYSDVHATIPFLWVSVGTLVLAAILAIWQGFSMRSWPLPLGVALYVAVSMVAGVYAGLIQRFLVIPNEQNMEQPFIEHNIAATRRAYGLNHVQEREISGDAELTAKDVIRNAGTIENVRLWDHEQLLQTFAQIQSIRTYYDFKNIDNDRYVIDGKPRQVMLSVRELNTESMPNRSWVNERLTFTHGYGLTLGPVNQVTTEGLPVLFVRDLPPVSTVDLRVDLPSIYYGEISSDYALVKTLQPEFHYPRGEAATGAASDVGYERTTYDGTGGVPVGSLLRRLMFAIRFRSTDILVSNQITGDSRIMFHRRIDERLRRLAPFLTYDADPYPVLSGGRLYWMQDAYTTTARYPYSTPRQQPAPEINYIRNSVKIVTDAYNGSVSFYLADPRDPLAQTLSNVFPGLFHAMDDMPADLRRHVRYPEDLFRTQAQMYATYHMTNPVVFYNKEDQWQWPVLETGPNMQPMQPYYTMMTLPGETETEFIQMLPFTPRAKDNLAAWMAARSDPEHYGQLVVFQFPKQKIVYGPRQIQGRINQDQVISPQITLWNQQGSQVIWGTLLVIPVGESLIYVRPLYLRSPQSSIPELKRVIVAYQNQIVMAETLTRCLAQIFGREVATALAPDQLASTATSVIPTAGIPIDPEEVVPAGTSGDLGALAAEAQVHFDNAEKAQRAGDWALYGEEMRKVRDVLERMQREK
jgi:uncharacterized membrane protein (UPF0182 family)